jgi:transcriptional regulator GlxA family with amidase domain
VIGCTVVNDNHLVISAMRIHILALDGVWDTGLSVMRDLLQTANGMAAAQTGGGARFDVSVVGVRRRVKTGLGVPVSVQPINPSDRPDWVVIPALNTSGPDGLIASLDRPDVREARMQMRAWHAGGSGLAAACMGVFQLAETGLLDGHEATTTWWLGPLFRQRYTAVRLDEAKMLVPAPGLVTAGAAMGHMDLALWLIRQASPELAALVARYMLADVRSSQAQYIIPDHVAHADPLMARFERWSRDRLGEGFSLQQAADALAISPRTLQRRAEAILGKSPLAFFQDLRVDHARTLIRGGLDLDGAAARVGYVDGATLSTLLRRRLGQGVRELRNDLR